VSESFISAVRGAVEGYLPRHNNGNSGSCGAVSACRLSARVGGRAAARHGRNRLPANRYEPSTPARGQAWCGMSTPVLAEDLIVGGSLRVHADTARRAMCLLARPSATSLAMSWFAQGQAGKHRPATAFPPRQPLELTRRAQPPQRRDQWGKQSPTLRLRVAEAPPLAARWRPNTKLSCRNARPDDLT